MNGWMLRTSYSSSQSSLLGRSWAGPPLPTPSPPIRHLFPLRSWQSLEGQPGLSEGGEQAGLSAEEAAPLCRPKWVGGLLLSWVKVFQSSWESFCFFSTTSFPPSTSTLKVYFCDFPILVRSPKVKSSFTWKQGWSVVRHAATRKVTPGAEDHKARAGRGTGREKGSGQPPPTQSRVTGVFWGAKIFSYRHRWGCVRKTLREGRKGITVR